MPRRGRPPVQAAERATIVRGAGLALLLCALGVVTLTPHADPTNGRAQWLPVHMDEYFHWGFARETVVARSLVIEDPFGGSGGGHPGFSVREDLHARGFQAD